MNTRTFPSGFRYFSKQINLEKAAPAFNYLYDPNLVQNINGILVTGGSRPITPTDLSSSVSISGGLTANVGNVAVTGTTNVNIVNPVVPISGIVTVNGGSSSSNGAVQITGNSVVGISGTPNVNIVNSAPLNVTGILSIYSPGNSVTNSTPSGSNGLAIQANALRKTWFIQNLATGSSPLFIRLGNPASSQNFNILLKAASSSFEGDGGSFIDDGPKWTGAVYVSGQHPNFVSWDII
jgi:hypothetical protein